MKINGRCPKCGESNVHRIAQDRIRRFGATIPIGTFRSADVDHYVCTTCGYVESYVTDAEAREKIAQQFPRVE